MVMVSFWYQGAGGLGCASITQNQELSQAIDYHVCVYAQCVLCTCDPMEDQ